MPKTARGPLAEWQKVAGAIVAGGAAIGVLYAGVSWLDRHWVLTETYAADYRQLKGDLSATNRVILEGQLREITGRILALEARGKSLTPHEQAYLVQLRADAERIRAQLSTR